VYAACATCCADTGYASTTPMSLDQAPEGFLGPVANHLYDVGPLWPTDRRLSIVHIRCSKLPHR
jgi:hypothetical protein